MKNSQEQIIQKLTASIDLEQYQSLTDLMQQSMRQYADCPAFQHLKHQLTYHDVDTLSLHVAAFLQHHLGLAKGERIALMMPNILQYPVMILGALKAGLIIVNVNPLYTADELIFQMNDADCHTIVVLNSFAHTVEVALPHTHLKNIIVTQIGDLFPAPKSWLINLVVKYVKKRVPRWLINNAIPFRRVLSEGKIAKFTAPQFEPEDIAFLQYTGGTTGRSKGAMLSHRNLIANLLQADVLTAPLNLKTRLSITALPIYHIFCLTLSFWNFHKGGLSILIMDPRDLKGFIQQIKGFPFTIFAGVNTLFNALLHDPEFRQLDFSHLKFTIGGGMAVQESVATSWQQVTASVLMQGYGLTEASPMVCSTPVYCKEFNGSVGTPVASTEISICDEKGKVVALGEAGELCVRGPQVMKGYWRNPQATAEVLSSDGWLRTGDIATIDENGYIRIVDRKKDMINVSGFKVYPNEVEERLAAHPGVLEAGVIGVPSDATGESVKAFVVLQDKSVTKDDLLLYCREHLTAYKIPHDIVFVHELPKTPVGKIMRRALRNLR